MSFFQNVFLFLHDLMRLLQHIESIYHLFIDRVFDTFFLSNQENLYMINHDSDLFYDIYNAINEDNRRQTHYLLLILPNYFDICFIVISKVLLQRHLLHH